MGACWIRSSGFGVGRVHDRGGALDLRYQCGSVGESQFHISIWRLPESPFSFSMVEHVWSISVGRSLPCTNQQTVATWPAVAKRDAITMPYSGVSFHVLEGRRVTFCRHYLTIRIPSTCACGQEQGDESCQKMPSSDRGFLEANKGCGTYLFQLRFQQ